MEYEIEHEDLLFDESTNPSLQHEPAQAVRTQSPLRPQENPADRRKLQRAELIPEEEHQLA